MSTPEICQFAIISTWHLSEATAKRLDDTPAAEWPCRGGPYCYYGWFVYAHEENLGNGDDAIPNDLFAAMTWARKHGFEYILFDCDADTVEGLTTYNW